MKQPNFLVIGDSKAGTTSLYHYLSQHPDVYMPRQLKELRYFAYDQENPYHRLSRAYPIRAEVEYLRQFADVGHQRAIGEASPNYLRSPIAAGRIRQMLPSVRLIASLRHPADRLYSHYLMNFREGRTRVSFAEEIFRRESAAIKANFYWLDLKRYYDQFSREQINVILFDDLQADPGRVTRSLYSFLDVRDDFAPELTVRNEGGLPIHRSWSVALYKVGKWVRSVSGSPEWLVPTWRRVKKASIRRQELDGVVRRKIIEICKDDIERTAALIGRDLSHWLDEFDDGRRVG